MSEEKKFTVKCEKQFTITSEDIDDIMCDALESGIGYWCGRAKVNGEYLGEYASDQISRGGSLTLYDIEDDDEKYVLDLVKFLNGYRLAIEQGYFSGDLDDDYDAGTADVIVQLAIFGEVVYG